MGVAESQHEVRVIADELNAAIRERLDALAGELSLEQPVTVGDDGVWVAARDLGRREAQALRRQLQGLGLAVDVVERSENAGSADGESALDADSGGSHEDDDLGLISPDLLELETNTDSPPESDEDPDEVRSAELLSWFGSADEIDESEPEAETTPDTAEEDEQSTPESKNVSPEELLGVMDVEDEPPLDPPEISASAPMSGASSTLQASEGLGRMSPSLVSGDGAASAISRSLEASPGQDADKSWDDDSPWVKWGLAAGLVAVVVAIILTIAFTGTNEETAETTTSGAAAEPPPTEYVLPEDESVPEDENLAELGDEATEPEEAEESPSVSDKAAATQLFIEGEARCRLKEYDACIATMEAVVTLDPNNQQAYEHILRARAAKERRENPPPTTGPVEPKTVIIGPDGQGPDGSGTGGQDVENDTLDSLDGGTGPDPGVAPEQPGSGGADGTQSGTREKDGEPQYKIDDQGRKVMVISPDSESPGDGKSSDGGEQSVSGDSQSEKPPGDETPGGPRASGSLDGSKP